MSKEKNRLEEHYRGEKNWLKWGPYLSERQWGTVREDYSPDGEAWQFFPHSHARSKVYRWGEDGLAGISDKKQNLCFALALWNGNDPILKERLFGLSGPQGNHGEDVKELYYYLDNVPTHSYMKQLYKYPHAAFPYEELLLVNAERSKLEGEYEIQDTAVFDHNNYFDVFTEYAKADEEDILIRITVHNRGQAEAPVWILPTLWFRNLWLYELIEEKPVIKLEEKTPAGGRASADHLKLGKYQLFFQATDTTLFTENETNREKIYGEPNKSPFVKDAFHTAVTEKKWTPYADRQEGTKFAPVYRYQLKPGEKAVVRLRLSQKEWAINEALGPDFEAIFRERKQEADAFYRRFKGSKHEDLGNIQRQALAGMLWTKQYYNIDIPRWLNGDPGLPRPPESRKDGRNKNWTTLNNEDIISMPDKWEYPWYAAWDLAFHCVPLAMVDPDFAKGQLILFLREWYMHPNGQIPAYEWSFSDVNPPVHAWACLQVYKMDKKKKGKGDKIFLERVFQKLLINFTWWVNRKDRQNNNVFEGGFLGLDNIGVFDRSKNIPGDGYLEQADGTAWMGTYSLNMLEMALILAEDNIAYEDVATKFFEHFVYIAHSLNKITHDRPAIWDEEEGFFYDILNLPDDRSIPIKVRSLVGLTTMLAVLDIEKEQLKKVPDFYRRLKWFVKYQKKNVKDCLVIEELKDSEDILLSLVPRERLERLLQALFDEKEFLSPGGIRSMSKVHETPYKLDIDGQEFGLKYEPAESSTYMFGGNSNWRGPVWMPMNYILISALRVLYKHYNDNLTVEFPTGSGRRVDLQTVADDLSERLVSIFRKDENGRRPVHGQYEVYQNDPHFRDLVLFYEYFHGDNARGVGASHQTGWTGLVATLIEHVVRD